MKKISALLLGLFMAVAVWAQTNTVTITVNGNKNWQVVVDGQSYTINSNHRKVTLTDLSIGQHSIELLRTGTNVNSNKNKNTSVFSVREGFNTNITVNGNGAINIGEARIKGYNRTRMNSDVAHDAYGNVIYDANGNPVYRNSTYGYGVYGNNGNYGRSAMSNADYNAVYNSVRRKWFLNSKYSTLENIFNNSNYYFTTAQAENLIRLVTDETNRLTLAKLAYARITDPMNFGDLYDLLTNTALRNELDLYARNYNSSDDGDETIDNTYNYYGVYGNNGNYGRAAMTDPDFNSLYTTIRGKWIPNSKYNSLVNTFNNSNYYFTTAQARQLIALVSDESNRLYLAKLAYARITDPVNFGNLYDLFTNSAFRNELDSYARSYHL